MAVNVLYIDTRQQFQPTPLLDFLPPPPPSDSFSKVLFNTYTVSISTTNFIYLQLW